MPFVSVTRLRIRSIRFLPFFAFHTSRSLNQVKSSPGFTGGAILADRRWTFWTMTMWNSHDSMRQYMLSGSHRTAMPHLLNWCDEASVVHWDQPEAALPAWTEADRRMRESGRISKARLPSPTHATLNFPPPRLTRGGAIPSAPVSPDSLRLRQIPPRPLPPASVCFTLT